MGKVRLVLSVLLLILMLSFTGCMRLSSKFEENGLPADRYLVGGGFYGKYVAPTDGTLYWVEETTQKILETESAAEGNEVEFGARSMDPEIAKKLLGIELSEAKFKLYFIPK